MKKNERFVAYGGCYGLLLLAAFLLQLKWQGYICCSIVFVLVMWRMDKVLKEEAGKRYVCRKQNCIWSRCCMHFCRIRKSYLHWRQFVYCLNRGHAKTDRNCNLSFTKRI